MVTALGAIVHVTPQRADVVRFYRDALELGDPDHLAGEELFQLGDLRLGVSSGDPRLKAPQPRLSLTFVVDDLEAQVGHMKGLGIAFELEPTLDSNGTRRAVCRDPDGNVVTLLAGPKIPGTRRPAPPPAPAKAKLAAKAKKVARKPAKKR